VIAYRPGATPAHRLDPRSKLAVQFAVAAAAFVHATPRGLAALSVVAGACLGAARLSPRGLLRDVRVALPFLVAAPVLQALTPGPPWVRPADAVAPALASYRVLLLFAVGGAYVHTTPARESRAAVQWAVPGRPGAALGLGVGLVFRFLPVLRTDLRRARAASHARLGDRRPLRERMRLVATAGLRRALSRADRLALALRARCLSWNPTLPPLRFGAVDVPALLLAAALAAWAAWGVLAPWVA
jgi:biotin transport system permease protein